MSEKVATPPDAPERVEGGLRWATLPNGLSLLRGIFLVPILWLLHQPDPQSDLWALLLLVVAGISDLLDGFLARARGSVSPTGKVVDPLADKILLGGLLVYLALTRGFPIWLVALMVVRDMALIGGAWLFFRRERIVFSADRIGKITTFFLSMLVLAYMLEWREWYPTLTVLATAMLALSYVSYGRRALRWWRVREPGRG